MAYHVQFIVTNVYLISMYLLMEISEYMNLGEQLWAFIMQDLFSNHAIH